MRTLREVRTLFFAGESECQSLLRSLGADRLTTVILRSPSVANNEIKTVGRFETVSVEESRMSCTFHRLRSAFVCDLFAFVASEAVADEITLKLVLSISPDGETLAETVVPDRLAERLQAVSQLKPIRWGEGIYGEFTGPKLDGMLKS